MTIRLARDKNYDLLLPTMEKVGFIQKGQQVSVRDIDEMLRQYVEPIEVEVFHYTRKWLQKMTYSPDRPVGVADQDGPADGSAPQAGHPDAGDRVGDRDHCASSMRMCRSKR